MLPTDYAARKALPIYDFLTKYFPLAIVEIVKVAVVGNEQHNPGEPLHWARSKSADQLNTAMRHLFDHGMGQERDDGGKTLHLAKAAWRLLAEIQLICERACNHDSGSRLRSKGLISCGDCGAVLADDRRPVADRPSADPIGPAGDRPICDHPRTARYVTNATAGQAIHGKGWNVWCRACGEQISAHPTRANAEHAARK